MLLMSPPWQKSTAQTGLECFSIERTTTATGPWSASSTARAMACSRPPPHNLCALKFCSPSQQSWPAR